MAKLKVTAEGSFLYVELDGIGEAGDLEIQLESNRNEQVTKMSDRSLFDPRYTQVTVFNAEEREIWFPVVDLSLEPDMEAVAVFDPGAEGQCALNGHLFRTSGPLSDEVSFPAGRLEHWENILFTDSSKYRLRRFYLRRRVSWTGTVLKLSFRTLSVNWHGVIIVQRIADGGVREEVARAALTPVYRIQADRWTVRGDEQDRSTLLRSLELSAGHLLRSVNRNPLSPLRGGISLFYDVDARTYRTPHWLWAWGPVIRMLLDASKLDLPGVNPASLEQAAVEMGEASLRFQIKDQNHPAFGFVPRWGTRISEEFGMEEPYNPADTHFLSGWGWISLYEHTGDPLFLQAAKNCASNTERLLREYELIPQEYMANKQQWTDHTLDEAGFGLEGLAELFRVTKDSRYKEIGRTFIEQLLAKLQRADGLWERDWSRSRREVKPTGYMTRGLGWSLEGLLAAHWLMPDAGYLELAERLAAPILDAQQPSGCWTFRFNQSIEESGMDEKGTSLWSYLCFKLHEATGNPRYMEHARKALHWCLKHQYDGHDPDAFGSLAGNNHQSGVQYRRWYTVACAYSSAFFGLAVLEQLKLMESR